MHFQCRGVIEVIDVLEPGMNKAAQREGSWTEFLAVLTMDYLEACEIEPDHELPAEVLHELESGQDGKRYWVVRLEAGEPSEMTFEVGKRVFAPWADFPRWHLIPPKPPDGPPDDFIDTLTGDLSTEVERECVRRLKTHAACEVCATATPSPST